MRKKLILEFFDRGNILNLKNREYCSYIKSLIDGQLKEDIDKGDITTNSLINNNKKINDNKSPYKSYPEIYFVQ